MTNATGKGKVAPSGFVPTRKIRFLKEDFQTVLMTPFDNDGWFPVGLEMLCLGDVDEGGELLAFLVEAAGEKTDTIDYDALLKCKVNSGVVESVYTPGIMGTDGALCLVSGENHFLLTYDAENQAFLVGNLKGKIAERTYDRADDTKGVAMMIVLTPTNQDLRVQYEIPFILKKQAAVREILGDGVEPSKELFEFLLSKEGVEGIANLLLQTLGSGGDRKKLHELGLGEWKVKGWNLLESAEGSEFPPNYELFLEGFDGTKIDGSYYTNKSLTKALKQMGEVVKRLGRQLKLIITDIRPFGQHYAVSATLQLIPEANPTMMKSAAVAAPQLAAARRPENAAEFMRTLQPIDVEVVPVAAIEGEATTGEATATATDNPDYDPIPF